ncbi:hypothetical protein DL96DRAFT_1817581 [Flagelloscypha sp. PMI_526]|nr:hypothetical protein DL96DRAFT_1817581 [Flagelloscypha sp. PMI_526]
MDSQANFALANRPLLGPVTHLDPIAFAICLSPVACMLSYRGVSSLFLPTPASKPDPYMFLPSFDSIPKQGSKTSRQISRFSSLSTPATNVQQTISLARECVIKDDPWVLGTLEVPPTALDLVLLDENTRAPTLVQLTENAAPAALDHLTRFCDPATFGKGGEDVLDDVGILDKTLPKLLRGPDGTKPVFVELYKLNMYGKGSFFRPHKDTPRSSQMFGSLVVVFPTPHEGGGLALRHQGKEGSNKVAYACFFSDVEHEVLPVTQGHRVTLTYNLYYASPPIGKTTPSMDSVAELKKHLQTLLNDPTFLPQGGIFGFGLNFAYPVSVGMEFQSLLENLKSSDAAVKLACTELGLPVSLRALIEGEYSCYTGPTPTVLLPSANSMGEGLIDGDFLCSLNQYDDGQFVHEMDSEPGLIEGAGEIWSKEIVWILPRTNYSSYKDHYIAYGNEASSATYYAEVCLIAEFGPYGDRTNTSAYQGIKTFRTW